MCLHFACCCAGGDYFCYACLPVISLSTWSLVNIFWWWVYWVPYPFYSTCAGKLCIEVTSASKIAFISEELCIGCGICVKVHKSS